MLLTAAVTCNFCCNLQCNVLTSYGRNDACRHLVSQRQIVPRVAGKTTCLPLFCNIARYIASFNMNFPTCLAMLSPHHCISSCRRKGSCSGTLKGHCHGDFAIFSSKWLKYLTKNPLSIAVRVPRRKYQGISPGKNKL